MIDQTINLSRQAAPARRTPAVATKIPALDGLAGRLRRLWKEAWYLGDKPADDNW